MIRVVYAEVTLKTTTKLALFVRSQYSFDWQSVRKHTNFKKLLVKLCGNNRRGNHAPNVAQSYRAVVGTRAEGHQQYDIRAHQTTNKETLQPVLKQFNSFLLVEKCCESYSYCAIRSSQQTRV